GEQRPPGGKDAEDAVKKWRLRSAMAGASRRPGARHLSDQMEKLVPQPHEAVAFGLMTLKEEPIRSSPESISEPAMYSSDIRSMSTRPPPRSMMRSSASDAPTRSNLY